MNFAQSIVLVLAICLSVALPGESNAASNPPDYTRDIQPLLARRCYECHGPKKQEGALRLDGKQAALKGGGTAPAVEPGKPADSLLIQYVTGKNEAELIMPPAEAGPPLTAAEIELLRAWIAAGAVWPQEPSLVTTKSTPPAVNHWAFQPIREPAVPQLQSGWIRTPIDAFILAKLNQHNFKPAPPADKVALVRRATFDLTGLPPTRAEVEAFVADTSDSAFDTVIGRLLASPRYGERWGRHWLDLARYADSNGFEHDYDRPLAFHYRDYVIRSLNADKPFDQYICEQLAGDELAPGDPDSITATGFCRCGPAITNQATEKNRLDELDDILSTTSTVFLGLTVGCARCHNHKLEPITQRDYYRMLAIFDGIEKRDVQGRMCIQDPGPKPPTTHILVRGNPEARGKPVAPGLPEVLSAYPVTFPAGPPAGKSSGRRTALAQWIASAENPLTARVIVNRVWQFHFGRGLVESESNFGLSGSRPSHPELLDWLARRFIDGGWRLKSLHKLIMSSAVYRQSSRAASRGNLEQLNMLLARYPIRRLEAEAVRDSILASSGCLNPQMFGPGIYPRIDPGVIATGSTKKWPIVEREGPREWRRSVYIFIKRSLLIPLMEGFDAPTTTDTCARRMSTTVATQSLQLLNGAFTNDQAERLAARVLREAGEDRSRQVESLYWLTLARPPTTSERVTAEAFLRGYRQSHRVSNKAGGTESTPQALVDLCHVMFNLNEFLYVN